MNNCPCGAVAMADAPFAALVAARRKFFAGGATLPYAFRASALEALLDAVTAAEKNIFEALSAPRLPCTPCRAKAAFTASPWGWC